MFLTTKQSLDAVIDTNDLSVETVLFTSNHPDLTYTKYTAGRNEIHDRIAALETSVNELKSDNGKLYGKRRVKKSVAAF
jgi:hypothetical protein